MQKTFPQTLRRAGFTLVEIMAVIVILSILLAVLVTSLGGSADVVHAKNTRMFLDQIGTLLVDYEAQKGDFPASSFPGDLAETPSSENMGAEMLVLSLYPAKGDYQADDVPEDRLCNSDQDETKRPLTNFASGQVFEFADDWGNPIVYLHRRDYKERVVYVTVHPETGERMENSVTARKSPKTGDYYQRKRFQLLSAGADGEFGTADDIANFDLETAEGE